VIPFVILMADAGFTFVLENLSPFLRSSVQAIVLLVAALFSLSLISSNAISNYEFDSFPEASILATYLRSVVTEGDAILVETPASYPTYYYLWSYGVHYLGNADSATGNVYYIVAKRSYTIEDMTDKAVVKILDLDNAALYESVDENR
jgi:hypothetical protein